MEINVYTDGACSNNGRSNAKAGLGIYFGENDPRNSSERIIGKQTNNTAELTAILRAAAILQREIMAGYTIHIYTDSDYAKRCCTTYGEKLAKKLATRTFADYVIFQNSGAEATEAAIKVARKYFHSIGK